MSQFKDRAQILSRLAVRVKRYKLLHVHDTNPSKLTLISQNSAACRDAA